MPNVYVYIMDNVGEALIAKRRGSAVTVDHQVPPIGAASLSEADPEIGELYRAAEQFVGQEEGSLKERLREQIARSGNARGLDEDLGLDWTERLPTDKEVAELKLHIHLINEDRIPLGLHVHSQSNPTSEAALLVTSMVGSDYVRRVALDEMGLREEGGTRWEAAKQRAVRHVEAALQNRGGRSLVACGRGPGQEHLRIAPAHRPGDPPDAARPGRRLHSSRSGRRPGSEPRGAPDCPQPVRHQPAGSAHAGRLGSRCRAGGCAPQCRARAARALPEKDRLHALEHRTDPALRHGLGADPTPDRRAPGMGSQRDRRDLELVPVAELGRPRIDVVIQAASLFRDTFPDRMEFLDKAVRLAAGAADGENFIADHVEESQIALKRAGMSAEDARLYAGARVFSNNVGGYGTALSTTPSAAASSKTPPS